VRGTYFEVKLDPPLSCEAEGFAMRHHSEQERAPRHFEIWGYPETLVTTDAKPSPPESDEWDEWQLLSKHVGDTTIGVHTNGMGIWLLDAGPHVDAAGGPKTETRFTKFRILKTGCSAAESCIWLHVSGFEVFGKLFVKRGIPS